MGWEEGKRLAGEEAGKMEVLGKGRGWQDGSAWQGKRPARYRIVLVLALTLIGGCAMFGCSMQSVNEGLTAGRHGAIIPIEEREP